MNDHISITQQGNTLVVDSRLIAERLGVKHKNFLETISKHQAKIEERFGTLAFETRDFKTAKGNTVTERYALLTEPQATTLMTFSRNTDQVVQCKLALVEAFEKAKQIVKTVIPAQNDRIRELELEVELAKQCVETERLRNRGRELDSSLVALHGAPVVLALRGVAGAIVEVEKPTIEVIKENVKFKGQTLSQIVEFLKKKHGIRNFKSGADLKRFLEQLGKDDLIAQTPRSVLQDYVLADNEEEVYRAILDNTNRQLLLGEGC